MRIVLIDQSLFTVPYDRALAGGLEASGHEVVLLGRPWGRDDPDPGDLTIDPAFYRFTASRAVAALPRRVQLGVKGVDHIVSMMGLRRRLAARLPDIIHFQWLPLPSVDDRLLPGLARLAPLVLTVHDTTPSNGDRAAMVRQRGFFRCLNRFEMLIVHTEQGRARLLERGVAAERVALLPHGLLDAVPVAPAMPDAMGGELTFLLFGKIKPYKGADVLIEAYARLPDALRAQARVRIIGKPYMPLGDLHDLARTLRVADRVLIEPRFVDDAEIPALFGPGVVTIFPYREIEASGVLSLALAYGRPIIASRIGSFGEVVADGRQGLLTPVDDVAAVSAAMARMIADRPFAEACAGAARALAEETPTWPDIARRTTAIYEKARLSWTARRMGAGAPSVTSVLSS